MQLRRSTHTCTYNTPGSACSGKQPLVTQRGQSPPSCLASRREQCSRDLSGLSGTHEGPRHGRTALDNYTPGMVWPHSTASKGRGSSRNKIPSSTSCELTFRHSGFRGQRPLTFRGTTATLSLMTPMPVCFSARLKVSTQSHSPPPRGNSDTRNQLTVVCHVIA